MHRYLVCIGFILSSAACATIPTAKTFFKQSNWPLWQTPVPETSHGWCISNSDDYLVTDMHAQIFYSHSREKKRLGNYFGFYHDASQTVYPFLRVDADDEYSGLRPQDIIHNAAHAAEFDDPDINPLAQTLTFAPSIEQYGFCLINSITIADTFTIQTIMPWTVVNHSLGLSASNTTKQEVENKMVTVADWFAGNVAQLEGNSLNQQDPLMYGKIVNQQQRNGLADITLLALVHPVKNETTVLGLGVLAVIPTTSRAQGQYLFEPLVGTGGHALFGITGRVSSCVSTILDRWPLYFSADATLRVGLSAHEIRTPGFIFTGQNGADAQFARYALGGKQNARRLFPLVNMLTQGVQVRPGATVDCGLGLDLHTPRLRFFGEYRFTHTGKEKIDPVVQWPSQTYSLSRLDYAQATTEGDTTTYHTFSIDDDASLLTGALSESALNFEAAATPAQTTHTISAGASLFPFKRFPFTSLGCFARYHFVVGSAFGVSGYTLSTTFSHSF